MVLAPTEKVVLGSIAFAIFWVLAVFPAFPFLPIGRTAGSLLGATLMVIFRVTTPDQAYAAIDLSILGLLFGTMVVSVYLEQADMFKYLGVLLSWKSKGAKDLICRICLVSAISSALFTNDTSCVVLTEFVLQIARQNNVPPHPFLLALASSANIGSSATPIGNPQNLVIAIQSSLSFREFLFGLLPAMLVGVLVNALILLCMYWRLLSVKKDEGIALDEVISEEDATSHRFSPAAMSHPTAQNSQELNTMLETMNTWSSPSSNGSTNYAETLRNSVSSKQSNLQGNSSGGIESTRNLNPSKEGVVAGDDISQPWEEHFRSRRISRSALNDSDEMVNDDGGAILVQPLEEKEEGGLTKPWKRLLWKTSVYLVTLGMLIAFLIGLNMSWTALTAALALMVLDFKDTQPCLQKVAVSKIKYILSSVDT